MSHRELAEVRKKPVIVEAAQWWPGTTIPGVVETPYTDGAYEYPAKCETLEGWHGVSPGDFIITGIKGERYPCRPDIFDATYEPV